jgi:heptose I phosphotransferase
VEAGGAASRKLLRAGVVSRCWRVERDGAVVYEKAYDVLWPWLPLLGVLKMNMPPLSAGAEARNAARLRGLGIEAPEVRALRRGWRLDWRRLGLRRLSCVELAPIGGERLDVALARMRASDRGRGAEADRRRRRRLARTLGALVARMHAAGIFHRDLYLCHVYSGPAADRLALIDVARADRRRWRTGRWRVKDLAALWRSVGGTHCTRADAVAFLRSYLGLSARGVGARLPASSRGLVRRVVDKARRMRRRGRQT